MNEELLRAGVIKALEENTKETRKLKWTLIIISGIILLILFYIVYAGHTAFLTKILRAIAANCR